MAFINGQEIVCTPLELEKLNVVVPDKNENTRGSAGLVKMYNESSGLRLDDKQRLCIAAANNADIIEKKSVNKPIVPANFEYALRNNMYNHQLQSLDQENEEYHKEEHLPTSAKLVKAYVDNKTASYNGDFSDIGWTEDNRRKPNNLKFPYAEAVKKYVEDTKNNILNGTTTYKEDLWQVNDEHPDKDKPPSALSVSSCMLDMKKQFISQLLNFKMAFIEKGETFTIKPGMLALVLPYGDYTLSAHKEDGTEIAASMGTTMVFASERDDAYEGDYWAAFLYAKNAVLAATVSSNHNRYSTNCYIKNNYSGSTGTGRAYIYYISTPESTS